MRDQLEVTSLEQLRALAHPLRMQILMALDPEPRTVSHLARELGVVASKVLFHIRVLMKAGLVELVETRPRGRVTEKYYRVAARNIHIRVPAGEGMVVRNTIRRTAFRFIEEALDRLERELARPAGERRGATLRMGEFSKEEAAAVLQSEVDVIRQYLAERAGLPTARYRYILAVYPSPEPGEACDLAGGAVTEPEGE